MRQSIAEVPALVRQKDLCLVLQAPKGGGMDDAVAVALEFGARRAGSRAMKPAQRLGGFGGIGGSVAHVFDPGPLHWRLERLS
ncbi:hypothetical protein D3C87_2060240 [compost metagenome]